MYIYICIVLTVVVFKKIFVFVNLQIFDVKIDVTIFCNVIYESYLLAS